MLQICSLGMKLQSKKNLIEAILHHIHENIPPPSPHCSFIPLSSLLFSTFSWSWQILVQSQIDPLAGWRRKDSFTDSSGWQDGSLSSLHTDCPYSSWLHFYVFVLWLCLFHTVLFLSVIHSFFPPVRSLIEFDFILQIKWPWSKSSHKQTVNIKLHLHKCEFMRYVCLCTHTSSHLRYMAPGRKGTLILWHLTSLNDSLIQSNTRQSMSQSLPSFTQSSDWEKKSLKF